MATTGAPLDNVWEFIAKLIAAGGPAALEEMQLREKLSGEERDAYEALKVTFGGYGLDTLAPKILEYVQQGYGSDTISILLQKSPEYKKRFAGNETRKAKGLPVLSPAEYLATEQSYRQLMRNAGLPEGFYDQVDDFTKLISGDVSPTELKTRVDAAVQATEYADPALKQSLKNLGVGDGGMVAWFLDPERATTLIQKEINASQIGAAALRNNLQMDNSNVRNWATMGVTAEQAQQGYGAISGYLGDAEKLASIYGDEYNQSTAEAEVFGQSGEARKKREGLASKERATFGGSVGAARKGLASSGGQQ